MSLSVVSTLYRSAATLQPFYERVTSVARKCGEPYEIVLVNDGSPDESLELAIGIARRDPSVKVVDLSRNFGHHRAMMTGLAHAAGDLVFLIDSDLEEDPELFEEFARTMQLSKADVVFGVQGRRKGGWLERITGALFYRVFNALSAHPIPANLLTVRLMTRRYVDALLEHREREITIAGLWAITGFVQQAVVVTKHSRGATTYDLRRKVWHLVDSITSFSNKPLVLIFYLGMAISVIAGVAAATLIVRRVFFGVLLSGWPSLIVSVWLLGGITLMCLGIIGIYLAKIFIETKQRPQSIVRQVTGAGLGEGHAYRDREAPKPPERAVVGAGS
jgi:putative glycosyltransferase